MPKVGIGQSLGSCKYYRYKGHGSDPCKNKTQHKQFFMLLITLQAAKASSFITKALPLPQGSPSSSAGKLHFNPNSFASVQHAFTLLKAAQSIAVSLKGEWSSFLCQTWHQHMCAVAQHTARSFHAIILGWLVVLEGQEGGTDHKLSSKATASSSFSWWAMWRISLVLPNMRVSVPTYCKWNWLSTVGIDAGSHKVPNQCIAGTVHRLS